MAKASDNVFPYVHVAPAAAPASPSAGSQRLYLDSADGNKLKRKDSSGVVTTIEGGSGAAFTSWTPVLTAATTSPTLGTGGGGGASGRYAQDGKRVEGDAVLQFGTTGVAAGSGSYTVSLPVAAATTLPFAVLGTWYAYDSSVGTLTTGVLSRNSSTLGQFIAQKTEGVMSHISPWAWATGDVIIVHFSYEAA